MTPETLAALAAQRTRVAWVGDTERMGWWSTDALSPAAGGAILKTLFARTAPWAGIEVAWACAAAVEARTAPPKSVTLFQLDPAIDAELRAWVRRQKRLGVIPTLPAGAVGTDPSAALREAARTSPTKDAREAAYIPGAATLCLGAWNMPAPDDDAAILRATEGLVAAYAHGSKGHVIIPYFERT